jgi:hypothetical protein
MSRLLLLIFIVSLFSSCEQKNKAKISTKPITPVAVDTSHVSNNAIYARSVTLFGDTSYKLNLHVIDSNSLNSTAILTLKKSQGGHTITLYSDSIETMNGGYIQFEDFNNDKIKDLMVFYSDGARANPRYHLYLIYPKSHELIRVKGFEELTNPEFDAKNNIITSLGLSGTDYYSFYRITKRNTLINLGHSFETSERHPNEDDDSAKYENAINKIKKENKIE